MSKGKIVKYTFDRNTGELIDKAIDEDRGEVEIYLQPVINILLKGLIQYIEDGGK